MAAETGAQPVSSLLIVASQCHLGSFETCRWVHHAAGWILREEREEELVGPAMAAKLEAVPSGGASRLGSIRWCSLLALPVRDNTNCACLAGQYKPIPRVNIGLGRLHSR